VGFAAVVKFITAFEDKAVFEVKLIGPGIFFVDVNQ
jgi:hypothetical protein